ncbi:MAG: ATP synthase F1 subunit delta [Cytophagaceae bacterium]
MHESRVASRYAKSLIDFAKEQGILEDIKNDMELFYNTCEKNPELVRTFNSPIIGNEKKRTILQLVFGKKVHKVTLKFFDTITLKNRENYLFFISNEFLAQYRKFKGIEKVEVVTASKLTDDQKKNFSSLVTQITGNKVELEEIIEEDIIGGFVLTISDRQIDESIKSKLQKLKSNFSYNPYLAKI